MEEITICNRKIGKYHPTYIIAEMSANHNQDLDQAIKIIKAAKEAGADAIKLQTYTPDTITIDCNNDYFRIKESIWEGKNLYELYCEAYTPWEWQPKLKKIANELGMDLFSTPFDQSAVDFLEDMDVPAYKIASFEITNLPLLRKVARTGKPILFSTGMATLAEIDETVTTLRKSGCEQLALLKCTSAYPAPPEEMNLLTIPHLAETFGAPSGLSDHTLGCTIAVASIALGACIVEKHLTLSRNITGPDSSFSLEPNEFKEMTDAIRETEVALGQVRYEITEREKANRIFRQSLFVVKDMKAGEVFTPESVRSIRPGYGLHTRHLKDVIGRKSNKNIAMGTPLTWDIVG